MYPKLLIEVSATTSLGGAGRPMSATWSFGGNTTSGLAEQLQVGEKV